MKKPKLDRYLTGLRFRNEIEKLITKFKKPDKTRTALTDKDIAILLKQYA